MELSRLRCFLTAAECQCTTKAAEHLQITQSALPRAIHRLEHELGVSLFDRKSRNIELNKSGRLLQKRLTLTMHALDRIPGELRTGQDVTSHTIHLKILAASILVANYIIAYWTLHPGVNFQLYQSDTNEDFDFCMTAIHSDVPCELEDYSVILKEELYLAVLTKPWYGGRGSVSLSETENDDYICLAGSRPVRKICNGCFVEANFVPNVVFENDTTESVWSLIVVGLGIELWPKYSWGSMSIKHMMLLPIKDQVCRRNIILIQSPRGKQHPALGDFYNFLTGNAKWL